MFGRSKDQIAIIGEVSERFRQTTMGVLRVAFLSAFALEMIGTISTAIIAVEVGLRLLAGTIAFRQALFVLVLAPEFYLPLRALGASFHAAQEGADAAGRIFAILHTEPSHRSASSLSTPASRFTQDVESPVSELKMDTPIHFRDVTVRHAGRTALSGVTFCIKPGETLALVGASGAGKSTIAHLLLRFVTPTTGQILVGGRPLAEIPLACWRQQIAWVPQSPALFAGTIAENIRLGQPDASEADVVRAAKLADLHTTVTALPHSYDTFIGEGGARLSGGQAQRLALARAFLVDTPFAILDEATAHLDPTQQARLTASISRLTAGRTVLIIAHQLATIIRADRVLVLDGGRLVEKGTPDDLRRSDGWFARLASAEGTIR
jgi:ABC-type transport system involved in cytochrome bd biosynthesis fused ATPase/permease subunit